jgi:calcium-dependent protein kinase
MQSFDVRIDNWCLGIILYIMISGKFPFSGKNKKEILSSIMNGVFSFSHPPFRKCSPEVRDLISKLLARNPNDRFSALEAIQHPWTVSMMSLPCHSSQSLSVDPQVISRLRRFAYCNEFKKWVSYMISLKLEEKNILELKRVDCLMM